MVCRTQVKNREQLERVLTDMGVAYEHLSSYTMFDGETVNDALVFRPNNWSHDVAVPKSGNLRYDNYEGKWGDEAELDKILQAYSVAELKYQSELEGYIITETRLDNGDIELVAEQY
jgi:hypothetical protein